MWVKKQQLEPCEEQLIRSRLRKCQGPASAGSRGTLRMNGVGERRHVRPALIGPSLRGRERERERVRERERESDQTGGAAESGKSLFFYRSFYILS